MYSIVNVVRLFGCDVRSVLIYSNVPSIIWGGEVSRSLGGLGSGARCNSIVFARGPVVGVCKI